MCKKIIFLTLAFFVLCISVFALPSPTNEFYVNDFANVIDVGVEEHIVNISAQIEKSTGAQIVVAAFQNTEGMTEAEYALKIGREWGIGDEEKDNGVLLMLALEERGVRIEVGLGLEGALPDGKCGRIIDEEIIPYFADGDWSQGFLRGFDRIVAEVCKEYGIQVPEEVDAVAYEDDDDEGAWIVAVVVFIIMIIYLNLIRKIPPSKRGGGGTIHHGGFYGGFGGRGGGGFSGGGFSGGGGSFGGGGAGRKF